MLSFGDRKSKALTPPITVHDEWCRCAIPTLPHTSTSFFTTKKRAHPSSTEPQRCSRCGSFVQAQDLERAQSGGSQQKAKMRTSRMSDLEMWQAAALQVLYSPYAKYYYGGMLVVNSGELVATILRPNRTAHEEWFMALEIGLVFLLTVEVLVRFVAEQGKFFRSKSNLFDTLVALLCLFTLIMVLLVPSALLMVQDWVAIALVRIRDTLRLLRLVFLLKNHRNAILTGQNLAPIQMRVDEHNDDNDHDTLLGGFVGASPAMHPYDPSLDFSSAFERQSDTLSPPGSYMGKKNSMPSDVLSPITGYNKKSSLSARDRDIMPSLHHDNGSHNV